MRLIHTITVVAIFHEAFFGNATWPTVKHAEAGIVRFPINVEVANVPLSMPPMRLGMRTTGGRTMAGLHTARRR